MSDRPNILVLLIDCLRHDRAVGRAGGAVIPALTELREAGTCFDTAIATVSCTTPSVGALLTGLYPPRNGILSMRGYRLRRGVVTLAGALEEAGYHCRAEVTGPLVPEVGLDRGFAEYRYRRRSRNVYTPFGGELLDAIRGGLPEPWFLFVHVWVLHRPRKILREFRGAAFGEMNYDRALTSLDTYLAEVLRATPRDTITVLTGDHGERMQEGDFSRQAYRYVSRIRALEETWDRWRLWRKKHRPKLLRRLLRIEGEGAYHGFHVHDYLVKVPLFLAGGPFPAGMRIPDQVRHVDLAPTLLEAAGVGAELPEPLDGRSLLPLVRGEALPVEPAYVEATGLNLRGKGNWIAGVRTPGWKYARRIAAEDPAEELFDLDADPGEERNLAGERPDVLERMRAEFESIIARAAPEVEEMSADEMTKLDERLRALGYMD